MHVKLGADEAQHVSDKSQPTLFENKSHKIAIIFMEDELSLNQPLKEKKLSQSFQQFGCSGLANAHEKPEIGQFLWWWKTKLNII